MSAAVPRIRGTDPTARPQKTETPGDRWARWRYESLLAWSGRNPAAGRFYATLVAQVEFRRDTNRRGIAVERIQRWLRVPARRARGIYLSSLLSEAREEADSARFMRDADALEHWLPEEAPPRISGPLVFVSLHLGTPVLGFVYLRRRCPLDVHAIVRGLDDNNPMLDAKRQWGQRKVAWVRELARGGLVGADAEAVSGAREHLLAGQAVFAALDVPGDVASRSSEVELHSERLVFSSGIVRLAALTNSTIVPMVALGGGKRMRVHFGGPIEAHTTPDAVGAVFAELGRFIDRFPGEWWMWPFLRLATSVERLNRID